MSSKNPLKKLFGGGKDKKKEEVQAPKSRMFKLTEFTYTTPVEKRRIDIPSTALISEMLSQDEWRAVISAVESINNLLNVEHLTQDWGLLLACQIEEVNSKTPPSMKFRAFCFPDPTTNQGGTINSVTISVILTLSPDQPPAAPLPPPPGPTPAPAPVMESSAPQHHDWAQKVPTMTYAPPQQRPPQQPAQWTVSAPVSAAPPGYGGYENVVPSGFGPTYATAYPTHQPPAVPQLSQQWNGDRPLPTAQSFPPPTQAQLHPTASQPFPPQQPLHQAPSQAFGPQQNSHQTTSQAFGPQQNLHQTPSQAFGPQQNLHQTPSQAFAPQQNLHQTQSQAFAPQQNLQNLHQTPSQAFTPQPLPPTTSFPTTGTPLHSSPSQPLQSHSLQAVASSGSIKQRKISAPTVRNEEEKVVLNRTASSRSVGSGLVNDSDSPVSGMAPVPTTTSTSGGGGVGPRRDSAAFLENQSYFWRLPKQYNHAERRTWLESKLADKAVGTWLLRYNPDKKQYIITLKHDKVLHLKLPYKNGQYCLNSKPFDDVPSLLEYFRTHPISDKIDTTLKEAINFYELDDEEYIDVEQS